MKKYLAVAVVASLFSGVQALRLEKIQNNSDQDAYLIIAKTQFAGKALSSSHKELQREELLDLSQSRRELEVPFYKADAAYVITRNEESGAVNVPEIDQENSTFVLATKKGIMLSSYEEGLTKLLIEKDGSVKLS
ncbi:hypothetical protein H0X06_02185 [Candidatus Dependentiae bacterium]|nr:hypothetical protein [Candidatus Dependentiae bacterium]